MHITLDTNVFGPLVSPTNYLCHPSEAHFRRIRDAITAGNLKASIAESSLTLESLNRNARINEFFREWGSRTRQIKAPIADPIRQMVVEEAFAKGISVLRISRIALPPFVAIPANAWAGDTRFTVHERLARTSAFGRCPLHLGLTNLKSLGARLVRAHEIDVSKIPYFPGMPPREEVVWLRGIVSEFDNPKEYSSRRRFSNHVRDLVAELSDSDMLAGHYGYGLDFVCTLDIGRAAGSSAILHPNKRAWLKDEYGIEIITPGELSAML